MALLLKYSCEHGKRCTLPEDCHECAKVEIKRLRALLEAAPPADVEPVGEVRRDIDGKYVVEWRAGLKLLDKTPLYTHPPADVEPVAWRWYNKHTFASVLGNYKPEDDTFPDSAIDIEPLYTQPPADKDAEQVIYDFGGFLTTRKERLICSSTDNASPMAEAIKEFLELRRDKP